MGLLSKLFGVRASHSIFSRRNLTSSISKAMGASKHSEGAFGRVFAERKLSGIRISKAMTQKYSKNRRRIR